MVEDIGDGTGLVSGPPGKAAPESDDVGEEIEKRPRVELKRLESSSNEDGEESRDREELDFGDLELVWADDTDADIDEAEEGLGPELVLDITEIVEHSADGEENPAESVGVFRMGSLETATPGNEDPGEGPPQDTTSPGPATVLIDAAIPGEMPVRGKRVGRWAAVILIAMGSILGGTALLNGLGIEIPLITRLYGNNTPDPSGNLKMTIAGALTRYLDHPTAGRLLVVNGRVRNDYDESRGAISVKGRLYSKDRELLAESIVYCGNILSDKDILDSTAEDTRRRLQDRRNRGPVETGGEIPFMIVFSPLPENAEEYQLNVEGSTGGESPVGHKLTG